MSNEDLEKALVEAVQFAAEFSWLFNFANVKILQVMDDWPQDWVEFLQSVKSPDELKPTFVGDNLNDKPEFVRCFVERRNDILSKLLDVVLSDDVDDVDVSNDDDEATLKLSQDLKRGMTPKKLHEVEKFSRHIFRRVRKLDRFHSTLSYQPREI